MVLWMRRSDPVRRRAALSALIVLVVLGVFGPASPALADAPTRVEYSVPQAGLHFLTGFCGVEIEQEGAVHIGSTEYADGTVIDHVHVDLVLSANGMIAYEQPRFTVVFDPESRTVTVSGTVVNIHAPGAGVLLQEVGRVVQDANTGDFLFAAGRFMIRDGETDRVCSYFGGS